MSIKYTSKYLISLLLFLSLFSLSTPFTDAASNETKYVDVTSGTLTLRSGPGTKYKNVGSLKKYSKVTVYKTKNGWSEINHNKKKAYVLSKYLVNVNLKNTRKSYTIKDANGSKYKVYMIGKNEVKAKASINAKYGWNVIWAGAAEGDTLYKGDYKLYLRKSGSNKVTNTGFQRKNYTYNKTRDMVHLIPSKYKGQPDLFNLAETMSSNYEEAQLYYVQKEKLKIVKPTFGYTLRPMITGKNVYKFANYSNVSGEWYINTYKLDLNTGIMKSASSKTVDSYPNWRKDWK